MFIKAKKRFNKTYFYLAHSQRKGKKMTQKCVYIGNRLNLSCDEWFTIASRSGISILNFFKAIEKSHLRPPYVDLAGLREAMRLVANSGPDYALLGLKPGATRDQIGSAFRGLSQRHHPDHGGDPARFRAIDAARRRLLGPTGRPTSGLQTANQARK